MNKNIMLHIIGFILLISSCTNPDTLVDKSKLLGADYRLFQETPAWELAKAVKDGDSEKIAAEIGKNKTLVSYRESRFGQPLLSLAVYNENYISVKTLLENGADPNMQDNEYGESPLMVSLKIGYGTNSSDTRFLKILLKYGGDPNAEQHGANKTKYTPLIIACENGKLDYIQTLVDAGAKINKVNEYGSSPLYNAAIAVSLNGDPSIVMYLLQKGADFKRILYKTVPEGESKYITDVLRMWRFDIGSKKYKNKMLIVDFLKKNGMDYQKAKIPEEYFEDHSKEYLERY